MKSASKMLSVSCLEVSLDLQRASNARMEPMQSPVTLSLYLHRLDDWTDCLLYYKHRIMMLQRCPDTYGWHKPQNAILMSHIGQKGNNEVPPVSPSVKGWIMASHWGFLGVQRTSPRKILESSISPYFYT